MKVPLAIEVILLLFKSLQARGRARLTTSAPSVPSICIRTNNHPQMSERVATYSVVTELSPVKAPLAIAEIEL